MDSRNKSGYDDGGFCAGSFIPSCPDLIRASTLLSYDSATCQESGQRSFYGSSSRLTPIVQVYDIVSAMREGWIYIMTNRPNGTLYLGVTSNLPRRVFEHREGIVEGFTKKYGLKLLVLAERHEDIRTAIQREQTMKHWPRAWKVKLILATNPNWHDLSELI